MKKLIMFFCFFCLATFASAQYQIWTTSSLEKVLLDQGLPAKSSQSQLSLQAAGNEAESGQIIIRANDKDLLGVMLAVSDLVGEKEIFSARNIKIYKQHYVEITKSTNKVFPLGWYPDALPPHKTPVNIQAGKNQGFWLTIKVPKGQKPGVYKGNVTILSQGHKLQDVPLTLEVWDFDLPDEMHTKMAFAIWGDQIAKAHGVTINSDEYWKLLDNYYWFQNEYRATPTDLPLPTENVQDFLEKAAQYIDNPKVGSFRIPFYYQEPEKVKSLVDGLRERGWLEKGYFYLGSLIDEPEPGKYPFVKELCTQLKEIAPDARHVVTVTPHKDLYGYVDTWCPLFSAFSSKVAHERQAQGEHIWWYGCLWPIYPFPSYHIDDQLMGARLLPWLQHFYGIEGSLYWSTTIFQKWDGEKYVERDPWTDPLAFPGANGDGFLLYPGNKVGIDGPVASIRLENIRDGLEDYEYLWLAEQRMCELASKWEIADSFNVQFALGPYYDRLFESVSFYEEQPAVLLETRADLAAEIATIMEPPYLLWAKPKTTELEIYVEPGAKVYVNDQEPVYLGIVGKAAKYLYQLAASSPSVELNLEVRAEEQIKRRCLHLPLGPLASKKFQMAPEEKQEKKLTQIPRKTGQVVIDGKLDDWTFSEQHVVIQGDASLIGGQNMWQGDHDLSGQIHFMWDEDNLYLAAIIKDDDPMQNEHEFGSIFQGDCVEVYLGKENDSLPMFTENDFQFGLSTGINGNGAQVWIWGNGKPNGNREALAENSELFVRPVPEGYIIEARISWQNFDGFDAKPGTIIGLDINLDDYDGINNSFKAATWVGDETNWQRPANWGEGLLIE